MTVKKDVVIVNEHEMAQIRGSISILLAVRECPSNQRYREELDFEIESQQQRLEDLEKKAKAGVTG